jgi:myo-inositol-1(or 4)-monophosphatase
MSAPGDLELIRTAAREAGELARALAADGVKVRTKSDGTPVSEADEAVDRFLFERLTGARPDYGWLSEETADDPARLRCERVFIVDPIDGTRAFIRGRPWWVVSIAVVERGRSIAGVLYAPDLDEMFEAERGSGVRLNGEAVQPASRTTLEGAEVLGDPHRLVPPLWPPMQIAQRNSVAYRVALVACGRFDAVIAYGQKRDWDLAAAALIAEEAGLVVGDLEGGALAFNTPSASANSLICAPAALAELILAKTRPIERSR